MRERGELDTKIGVSREMGRFGSMLKLDIRQLEFNNATELYVFKVANCIIY